MTANRTVVLTIWSGLAVLGDSPVSGSSYGAYRGHHSILAGGYVVVGLGITTWGTSLIIGNCSIQQL